MRLLIRFSKRDNLKYISHLDLQGIFIHAFNRTSFKLKYSKGFNPHPKIIFAMPLSLGFISDAEYLESTVFDISNKNFSSEIIDLRKIEIDKKTDTDFLLTFRKELEKFLPAGIKILYIKKIESSKNNIASLPYSSEYKILIKNDNSFNIIKKFNEFISDENLEIRKTIKKTDREKIIPIIKNIIYINIDEAVASDLFLFDYADAAYRFNENKNIFFTINANLLSTPTGNLNPKDLLNLFMTKHNIELDYEILRTNIYAKIKGNIIRFDKLF
ncbi:MAG: TIGR03936 family radical SAM-associated protein [Clostridiales Family XIII bacterium]|jgi:uncharacterized protein (DUF2344 family)|nr:TIGR03936 family radical SAM-associated protein [Clostridiales Family XIII bacterium]